MSSTLLDAQHIIRQYRARTVLDAVDVRVDAGSPSVLVARALGAYGLVMLAAACGQLIGGALCRPRWRARAGVAVF